MNDVFESLMADYISDDQLNFHVAFHALTPDGKAEFLDYVSTRGKHWAESIPGMIATYFRMISLAELLSDEVDENATVH